jgi:hypothetical protein
VEADKQLLLLSLTSIKEEVAEIKPKLEAKEEEKPELEEISDELIFISEKEMDEIVFVKEEKIKGICIYKAKYLSV